MSVNSLSNSTRPARRMLPVLAAVPFGAQPASDHAPRPAPWRHLLAGATPLVFLVQGSQLFAVSAELFAALEEGQTAAEAALRDLAAQALPPARVTALAAPRAVSLNLAHACNLACNYCYADEGLFGGRPHLMTPATAERVIDQILAGADGGAVTIGFIGGEPLLNRPVLRHSVAYARQQSAPRGVKVGFSLTTNATLLQADDLDLLRENAFTVTVSLDGAAQTHDRVRRTRRDTGSFSQAMRALQPLLDAPGPVRLSARATITRRDLDVAARVRELAELGFRDIGVSPLRTGPDPSLILTENDWPHFLSGMIAAADAAEQRLAGGGPLYFSNFAEALRHIHRGTQRALPCGAAANYISASASGGYFTCHRTIDQPRFAVGDSAQGFSETARRAFVEARQVDRQEPCASCWARYLCGGGCHAEVLAVGRGGCDYIRGWLEHCLRAYNRIAAQHPALFS